MVDTVRTLAALQALLADNTTGDISAQDARDVLVSTYPQWQAATIGAYDDYFTSDTSADYTAVTPTGTASWNVRSDARLGVYRGVSGIATDQTGGDASGYLKSLAGITTGDYIQSFIQGVGAVAGAAERRSFGLVLSDGVAAGSNLAGVVFINDTTAVNPIIRHLTGTFTAMVSGTFRYLPSLTGGLHVQVTYSAASTFQVRLSLNGEDFWQPVEANISTAFTPTHGGWIVSSDAEATSSSAILGKYFHSNVTP